MKKYWFFILIALLIVPFVTAAACKTDINYEPGEGAEAEAPPSEEPTSITHTLSVAASPSGGGTVSPSSGQYEEGTQVTLSATAASGYTFEYWSGDASGSAIATSIIMDSDKSVIAYFKLIPEPELTTQKTEVQILEHHLFVDWHCL
jgi:hypothetical protein